MRRPSRRDLLGAIGAATVGTAGCLGFGASGGDDPPQGTIVAGETTREPITDGSLASAEQPWPTAQFDAQNTSYNPDLSAPFSGVPQVKWHRQLAEEEDDLAGSPSLHDGTVFVTTEERLYALDPLTGADKWSVSLPKRGETTPTATDRHVFVGTDGELIAIDRDSQSIGWRGTTERSDLEYSNPLVHGAPTVVDDTVVVGTADGLLAAFEVTSGDLQWSHTVTVLPDESATPAVGNTPFFNGPPAVANNRVYAGNANHFLYAFDIETGEKQWETESSDAGFEPAPTINGDTVYAVADELIAVAHDDGTVQWRFSDDPGSMVESAVIVDETVYVASGDSTGSISVKALDLETRDVKWQVGGRPQATPSAGPQYLYVPLYGNLVAIDRESGEIAWELELESVAGGPPVLTTGGLVTADERGAVFGVGPAE